MKPTSPTSTRSPHRLARLRGVLIGGGAVLGLVTVLLLTLRPSPAPTSTAIKPPVGERVDREGDTVPLERAGLSGLEAQNTISGPADPLEVTRAGIEAYAVDGGEELYLAACASCHMADGLGARGAGVYPALAGNPKMQRYEYVTTLILHGAGGMPGFQDFLTDEQVAEIVNYVRQDLNRYSDPVNAPAIRPLRRPSIGPGIDGEAG